MDDGQRDPLAEALWLFAPRRFARIDGGVLIEIVIANGFAFFSAFVNDWANAWVSCAETASGEVGLATWNGYSNL
jgi:hypothetical protein